MANAQGLCWVQTEMRLDEGHGWGPGVFCVPRGSEERGHGPYLQTWAQNLTLAGCVVLDESPNISEPPPSNGNNDMYLMGLRASGQVSCLARGSSDSIGVSPSPASLGFLL